MGGALKVYERFLGGNHLYNIVTGFFEWELSLKGFKNTDRIHAVYFIRSMVSVPVKGTKNIAGAGVVCRDDAIFARNRMDDFFKIFFTQ